MAEGSTLRPATDAQTLSSDGGSSRAGSPEDQYFDESYYNELVAGADERDEKDRETLVVPRVRDVWDMDFSNEDEATTTFHMFNELPLNHPTSTTSHWDASIPQLYPDIGGASADVPWNDYLTDLYSEQEMSEDKTCSPQHAARPPLSGLTNLDFSWLPQDFSTSTTPLAPAIYQQNTNDENQPPQLQQFQVRDAPHAFTRLPQPQHVTAFAAAHSTNATDTQGAGSLAINLEDGENGEVDAGVHSETNGDKSDDDALSGPKSSPAETSTTYSEATTPYFSEPQDSPASSPPSEVAETQAGPTESSLENSQEAEIPAEGATDAQSTPSEEPSAPTAAAEEPVCSDKKTSSRKRRLSEAEDQPGKRPATESKVASNAVDNDTLPVLYAAPPSPPLLPAVGAPADAPAVESEAPSGATDEETGPEEASETVTTNATSAVASDVVSPTTAASPAPQHIPLGPSGHYASADAHLQDIFDAPLPDSELPEPTPLSHVANDGVDQQDGGISGPPSDASGAVIPTPTPALAQPVPVNATHGLASTVVPGNTPIAPPSLPVPSVSNSGSGAPAPRSNNRKQPKKKEGTSTGKKGGRGARSNNNNETPDDKPWLQGTIFNSRVSAQPPLPQSNNAGPSNGSTSNGTHKEKKVSNPWGCYLKATRQSGSSEEAQAAWRALTDAQRLPYEQMYNNLLEKRSQERQARRNARSTPASSSG